MKSNRLIRRIIGVILSVMLCMPNVGLLLPLSVRAEESVEVDIRSDIESQNVFDSELEAEVPAGVYPKKDWNDEQWKVYYRRIAQVISNEEMQCLYLSYDYAPWKDIKVYYKEGWNISKDDMTTEGVMRKAEALSDYPGCYVIQKAEKQNVSEDKGYFYVYATDETDATKSILSIRKAAITVNDKEEYVLDIPYYTVSYEQGEIDTKNLPESELYYRHQGYYDPKINGIDYEYGSNMVEGAYYFTGWKDRDGEPYENSTHILKPLVLHPEFTADVVSKCSSSYERKTIQSAAELLQEVCMTGEDSNKILLIDSDIVIDKDAVNAYIDSEIVSNHMEDKGYSNYYKELWMTKDEKQPGFAWSGDIVVVKDGASLTFDSIYTGVYRASGTAEILVLSGGKLNLINDTRFNASNDTSGYSVSLQENATMDIINNVYAITLYRLCNHGTVTVKKPEGAQTSTSSSSTYLRTDRGFYNGKTGTVSSEYERISVRSEDNKVINVNRGMITTTEDGVFVIDSNSPDNREKHEMAPFVNDGKMVFTTVPPNYYNRSPFIMDRVRFTNTVNGLVQIEQVAHTPEDGATMKELSYELHTAGMYVKDCLIVNEGTIKSKAVSSVGILLNAGEPFVDPNGYNGKPEYALEYAGIQNKNGGKILLESGKNSIAMNCSDYNALDNDGEIILTATDKNAIINNITLCSSGKITNNGSISGDGTLGHSFRGAQSEASRDLFSYVGKPAGVKEFYSYDIIPTDENESNLPETVQASIQIGDESLGSFEAYSGFFAFMPKGEQINVKLTATGYKDASETIQIPDDMDTYKGKGQYGYSYRKWNYKIVMQPLGGTGNSGEGDSGNTGDKTPADQPDSGSGSSTGDGNGGGSPSGNDAGSTDNGGNNGNTGTEDSKPVNNTKPVDANDGSKVTTTSKGEATVTEVKKTNSKSITVPSTTKVDGVDYNVTTINANAFKNATKAKTVTLPDTITKIKANAFASSKIETVKITIKKGGKLTIDKKAFKKSKVKKVQVFMNKKATKKEQNAVINALKKAGIKVKNIKVKLK